MAHISVLQKEVIKYLDPSPNENFIDCTFGEGGHALSILEKNSPGGKVLGIDWEIRIQSKDKRLISVQDNFANLKEIVEKYKFKPVHGILMDLGMSSWHLDESGRGFSFKRKEPLDMRYDKNGGLTAEKIVNHWSESEIQKILTEYGEERRAGNIAKRIIEERKWRPIKTADQLAEIVNKAGSSPRQTFQAIRIAVNDELINLEKVLPQAVEILEPGGRLAVISFHSLEDRIVKNFFSAKGGKSFEILTKKPITPNFEETTKNSRARSAKLRAIKKL